MRRERRRRRRREREMEREMERERWREREIGEIRWDEMRRERTRHTTHNTQHTQHTHTHINKQTQWGSKIFETEGWEEPTCNLSRGHRAQAAAAMRRSQRWS